MNKKTSKKLKEEELVTKMHPQQVPAAQPATPEEVATATSAMPGAAPVDPAAAADDVTLDPAETAMGVDDNLADSLDDADASMDDGMGAESMPGGAADLGDDFAGDDFAGDMGGAADMGGSAGFDMGDGLEPNGATGSADTGTFTAPAPGMVPSGWVDPSDLAEVVTQEIAAAQETGDVEAAAAVQQEELPEEPAANTQDPLVADPNSQIAANANAPTTAAELSPEEQDVILEYRKYKASKGEKLEEETDPITGTELDSKDEEDVDVDADDAEAENVEDTEEVDVDTTDEEVEDVEEDLPPVEDDFDEGNDFNEVNGIEINDEALKSVISDFLSDMNDDSEGDTDIPEALRTAANFFDDMLGTVEEVDEVDASVADENSTEDTRTLNFADVVGDPSEEDEAVDEAVDEMIFDDAESDADDVEDLEESVKKPHVSRKHLREAYIDDTTTDDMESILMDALGYEVFLSELIRALDDDTKREAYEYIMRMHDLDSTDDDWEDDEVDDEFFEESTKTRKQEKIIYPAGSESAVVESAVADSVIPQENILAENTAKMHSRREAIARYKESISQKTSERKKASVASRSRFSEALNAGSKLNTATGLNESTESSKRSWASNKFLDRFEESSKLDFQKLLEDGFLG